MIATCDKPITAVLKFRVFGSTRYLSHAETLRVFHRACGRAGVNVAYTEGFNPRPRISLPLPRSVGLACEDEICCFQLKNAAANQAQLRKVFDDQMPWGVEIVNAQLIEGKSSFNSGTAVYELNVESLDDELKGRCEEVLSSDELKMQRHSNKPGRNKTVDVRKFLESIEFEDSKIIVKVKFGPDGSMRVDEISDLLRLDDGKLNGPVKRLKIIWESNVVSREA